MGSGMPEVFLSFVPPPSPPWSVPRSQSCPIWINYINNRCPAPNLGSSDNLPYLLPEWYSVNKMKMFVISLINVIFPVIILTKLKQINVVLRAFSNLVFVKVQIYSSRSTLFSCSAWQLTSLHALCVLFLLHWLLLLSSTLHEEP